MLPPNGEIIPSLKFPYETYSVQLRYFMQRRRDCGQCPQLITKGDCTCRSLRSVDSSGLAKGNFAGDGTVQLFHNWSPNRYTPRYSAFRSRGRVVLRAGGGGQHVRDEFRRSCAGEHSGPRIFMAKPRRTPGMYIHEKEPPLTEEAETFELTNYNFNIDLMFIYTCPRSIFFLETENARLF